MTTATGSAPAPLFRRILLQGTYEATTMLRNGEQLILAVVLPLLTIIADFLGLVGGYFIAYSMLNITTDQYWSTAWRILEYNDLTQGLVKPFLFAIVIALVGCYYGMNTSGGSQGVGRSTSKAVVVASVLIFISTSMLDPLFVNLSS